MSGKDPMGFEDELRAALHRDAGRAPAGAGLDAGEVIARSRARRRPRVALASGATALMAVGVLAIAVPAALQPLSPVSMMSEPAPELATEAEDSAMPGGAARQSLEWCGLPLDQVDLPALEQGEAAPVTATLDAPPLTADSVEAVTLVLTSTAEAPMVVTTPSEGVVAILTVGGLVAAADVPDAVLPAGPGASFEGQESYPVDPGESIRIPVTVVVSSCDPAGLPLTAGPAELLVGLRSAIASPADRAVLRVMPIVAGPFPVEIVG